MPVAEPLSDRYPQFSQVRVLFGFVTLCTAVAKRGTLVGNYFGTKRFVCFVTPSFKPTCSGAWWLDGRHIPENINW